MKCADCASGSSPNAIPFDALKPDNNSCRVAHTRFRFRVDHPFSGLWWSDTETRRYILAVRPSQIPSNQLCSLCLSVMNSHEFRIMLKFNWAYESKEASSH